MSRQIRVGRCGVASVQREAQTSSWRGVRVWNCSFSGQQHLAPLTFGKPVSCAIFRTLCPAALRAAISASRFASALARRPRSAYKPIGLCSAEESARRDQAARRRHDGCNLLQLRRLVRRASDRASDDEGDEGIVRNVSNGRRRRSWATRKAGRRGWRKRWQCIVPRWRKTRAIGLQLAWAHAEQPRRRALNLGARESGTARLEGGEIDPAGRC
jgi:hypothetical protein